MAAAPDPKSPQMITNIFGCLEHPIGCLVVCLVPCIPIALTETAVDDRKCDIYDALCCANGYQTRQRMRKKYGIAEDKIMDLLYAWCCGMCFTHQNVRELAARTGQPPQFLPA